MRRLALLVTTLALIAQAAAADTVLQTVTGAGARTTRPFTVANDWEVQWDLKGDLLQIYLFDAGSGKLLGLVANESKPGPGASYVREGGRVYLQMNGMGDWTVRVVQIDPKK